MGESKKNEGGEKKKNGEVVEKKEGEGNKNDGNLTVVLESGCHCDGCVRKVVRAIRGVEGVENVTFDADSKKFTAIGEVDMVMVRKKVEQKTHKHVELISPVPKKDGKGKGDAGAGEEKKNQKKETDSKDKKGGEDKKRNEKESKKNEGGEKKKNGEVVEKKEGEGNKNDGKLTVALESGCHCDGCVRKVVRAIRGVEGVENVTFDADSKKFTAIGEVDMVMVRKKVEQKTHKHVELISPVPKKDGKGKGDAGAGEEKKNQKKETDSKDKKGGEDKKRNEKEPPVTTAVSNSQECIQKNNNMVITLKGYKYIEIDVQKGLVTLTGSMNMKDLTASLKKHFMNEVEIVPPKKKGGDAGGENGKGGGNGGDKRKGKWMVTITKALHILELAAVLIGFLIAHVI